jgi:biopolymer transport protein ExbB/TolQ
MVVSMNLLGLLESGLFALGQVLRLPVIVLLWVSVGAVLYQSGRLLVEVVARRRDHAGFDMDRWLSEGPVLAADESRRGRLPRAPRVLLEDYVAMEAIRRRQPGVLENMVAEHDEQQRATLSAARSLVRIGPSLGLLGTLIPMGGSLAAMAGGNLQAMAGQMVVAFTSTIIGLATGTAAYGIATLRQGWVNQSIREQRYLAERLAAESTEA